MTNMLDLMKKYQKMQNDLQGIQSRLEDEQVVGTAGAGMVNTVVNGKGILISVKIDPTLINAGEKEILEDLIVAAVNDAKIKAQHKLEQAMGDLTNGMGLPSGMKFPF